MTPVEPQASTCKKGRPKATKEFFDLVKTRRAKVKLEIVRRYLGAWAPIFSHTKTDFHNYIVYVDGFAGTGVYKDDEYGSPTIAYKLLLEHTNLISVHRPVPVKIFLIFVELLPKRSERLRNELMKLREAHKDSRNASIIEFMVISGEFEKTMEWIISDDFLYPENSHEKVHSVQAKFTQFVPDPDSISDNKFITGSTPLLVFADPFGYSVTPMSVMRNILASSSKAEVFLNIMTGSLVRFLNKKSVEELINEFLGSDDWRNTTDILDSKTPQERRIRLLKFYHQQISQLEKIYNVRFEMRNEKRNRVIYHLFFLTQHPKGVWEMKAAMRPNSQNDYNFVFSEWKAKKKLKRITAEAKDIALMVREKFQGKVVSGFEITTFLNANACLFQRYKPGLKKELKDWECDSRAKAFNEKVYDFGKTVEKTNTALSTSATTGIKNTPRKKRASGEDKGQPKISSFFKPI